MTEDPIDHPHAERTGIVYASAAYLIWAVMPLYWNLLVDVPSVELATHRILWCALCVFAISLARGRFSQLMQIVRTPKLLRTLDAHQHPHHLQLDDLHLLRAKATNSSPPASAITSRR